MRYGLSTLIARWSIGLVVVVLCASAQAQSPVLESAAAEWLQCLTPAASKLESPKYPADALKLNAGAVVKARITFKTAADAPVVDVYYNTGGLKSFDDAVRDRVSTYRLPCLPENAPPVEVVQSFSFNPHDARAVLGDVEEDASADASNCRFVAGMERAPNFPRATSMRTGQGTAVISMTFNAPGQAPATKILYRNGSAAFAQSAENHVKTYRVECAGAFKPMTSRQVFRFVTDGDQRFGLQNLTLSQLVGAVRNLQEHRVRFDLDAMGCPFDLRFSLYRPHAANAVNEVEQHSPSRKQFIQWLKSVELNIPHDAYDDVLGQPINLSIPCGKLDLT